MNTTTRVRSYYARGAAYYDLSTHLYRLIGVRMKAYRRIAVEKLALKRGDHVVELGCGTGLNFPLILERIGPEGKLTGVDLTPEMLELARRRIHRAGWENVELVQQDIENYDIPAGVNGVITTGVFGYIAGYDRVIGSIAQALAPGGRLVILDGKEPESLPGWLFSIVLWLGRPFDFTRDYLSVRPWESVQRYFPETSMEKRYGGMIYIVSGVKGA